MNLPTPSRRQFIQTTTLAVAAVATTPLHAMEPRTSSPPKATRPRCITMWDFSWIERRWPGAGYENWPQVLDELRDRGYDAIRLDAFPHLIATEPEKEWTLLPVWYVQDWGSPAVNKISRLQSRLHEFIGLCKQRDIQWHRHLTDLIKRSAILPELQNSKLARRL